ncbi:hypothetical protein ACFQU2_19980 [Siccirubricoccus deserti]
MHADRRASIDYEAFRAEVRDFALTQCPPELRLAVTRLKKVGRHEMCTWQRSSTPRAGGAELAYRIWRNGLGPAPTPHLR